MIPKKLLVVGAGGHGKVVIDAVRSAKLSYDIVVADDDERKHGQIMLGLNVIVPVSSALDGIAVFCAAVGDNATRERITKYLASQEMANPFVLHPKSSIAATASIGSGAFVAAQAVIGPDAVVATGCIINHGAIVDHDCKVDAFSHVAPGATLGGGVHLGTRVLIGAGANILPGVSIGDDCVIGAGAVVLNDVEQGSVWVGVPARKFR